MSMSVAELKKQFSQVLREIPGVSGVGTAGGKLTVYLIQDLPGVKNKVLEIVQEAESDAEVQFIVTGEFRAVSGS